MTVHVDEVAANLAGRPALLRDACARALAYLDGLADRPVAPAAADVAALGRLDFALPGPGLEAAAVLALLDEAGSPATVASGGPRYFGFVTGGALPVAHRGLGRPCAHQRRRRRRAGGRNLLVRADHVARARRYAGQRELLEHH